MSDTPTPDVVGIDLGTTYSLAAVMRDGAPVVVRDADGTALVPSVVSVRPDGTVLVGEAAKALALSDPSNTLFSVKRLMGRTRADLGDAAGDIPHPLTERDAGDGRTVLGVRLGGREWTPEELSARILAEVRRRAGNPTKAVITVPAYFDDTQRQATRDAGRIAGLDVLRIVNEPTAAALAYGLDRRGTGVIAVYDLGGGTFDCSILRLSDGVFRVLSTNGDTRLGGDDFDRAVRQLALAGLPVDSGDAELAQALRAESERVKIALTDADAADFRPALPGRGEVVRATVTRAEFERAIDPLIERSLDRCRSALRDAELTAADIDEVVLVGGSTRVPAVRRRVGEFFRRTPHTGLNPDEVVALGAAVQTGILTGQKRNVLLLDVIPLSLGIETMGGVVDKVIHRNTTVPARATTRYTTYADNQTAVLLNIYQGERELTKDCRYLGAFQLGGIPPMPAQLAQVDVTFLVDANGILTVTAKELRSGQEARVTVQPAHGLTQGEVERLVEESVTNAQADFSARRAIELKAKGENDLRHAERGLSQAGDRLSDVQRAAIESTRAGLRAALDAPPDAERLQQAVAAFGAATLPLATILMNAVVRATFAGKGEGDVTADNVK